MLPRFATAALGLLLASGAPGAFAAEPLACLAESLRQADALRLHAADLRIHAELLELVRDGEHPLARQARLKRVRAMLLERESAGSPYPARIRAARVQGTLVDVRTGKSGKVEARIEGDGEAPLSREENWQPLSRDFEFPVVPGPHVADTQYGRIHFHGELKFEMPRKGTVKLDPWVEQSSVRALSELYVDASLIRPEEKKAFQDSVHAFGDRAVGVVELRSDVTYLDSKVTDPSLSKAERARLRREFEKSFVGFSQIVARQSANPLKPASRGPLPIEKKAARGELEGFELRALKDIEASGRKLFEISSTTHLSASPWEMQAFIVEILKEGSRLASFEDDAVFVIAVDREARGRLWGKRGFVPLNEWRQRHGLVTGQQKIAIDFAGGEATLYAATLGEWRDAINAESMRLATDRFAKVEPSAATPIEALRSRPGIERPLLLDATSEAMRFAVEDGGPGKPLIAMLYAGKDGPAGNMVRIDGSASGTYRVLSEETYFGTRVVRIEWDLRFGAKSFKLVSHAALLDGTVEFRRRVPQRNEGPSIEISFKPGVHRSGYRVVDLPEGRMEIVEIPVRDRLHFPKFSYKESWPFGKSRRSARIAKKDESKGRPSGGSHDFDLGRSFNLQFGGRIYRDGKLDGGVEDVRLVPQGFHRQYVDQSPHGRELMDNPGPVLDPHAYLRFVERLFWRQPEWRARLRDLGLVEARK